MLVLCCSWSLLWEKVEGMVCAACAGSVEKAVKRLSGIQDATVALLRNRVQVLYRPAFVEVTYFF
jgi:Cu+-exporting ATPase